MKKKYSLIAVLLVAVILVFGCLFFQNRSHEEKEEKKTLRVGVTLYRGDDSFINNLCGKMEEKAKAYEKETGDSRRCGRKGQSEHAEQPGGPVYLPGGGRDLRQYGGPFRGLLYHQQGNGGRYSRGFLQP